MLFKWYPIPSWPDYWATMCGRIGSTKYGKEIRELKSFPNRGGYLHIILYKNKKAYTGHIHRLILETFVGPCPKGMWARHLNGDPVDNRIENLCWDTPKNNQADKKIHGTSSCNIGHKNAQGEKHGRAKLTEDQVLKIREMYVTEKYFQKELAKMFRVSRSLIGFIVNRKNWRHI